MFSHNQINLPQSHNSTLIFRALTPSLRISLYSIELNFKIISYIFNSNYSFKMTWTINPVKSGKHLEANNVIICFKRGHAA